MTKAYRPSMSFLLAMVCVPQICWTENIVVFLLLVIQLLMMAIFPYIHAAECAAPGLIGKSSAYVTQCWFDPLSHIKN